MHDVTTAVDRKWKVAVASKNKLCCCCAKADVRSGQVIGDLPELVSLTGKTVDGPQVPSATCTHWLLPLLAKPTTSHDKPAVASFSTEIAM